MLERATLILGDLGDRSASYTATMMTTGTMVTGVSRTSRPVQMQRDQDYKRFYQDMEQAKLHAKVYVYNMYQVWKREYSNYIYDELPKLFCLSFLCRIVLL